MGPYIQLAQVVRFRALPEQDTVLRVEYDILLAVGDAHCSEFNQHKLGRTSENEHMAEFEEVGACVGVHFVQTSLTRCLSDRIGTAPETWSFADSLS